jgi:hypothetical protein
MNFTTDWFWSLVRLDQVYRLPIHEPKKGVKLGDTFD